MNYFFLYRIINYIIASIWLVNGFLCKVLNLVPRHEQIVSRILGDEYSRELIILIGISEIAVAGWILLQFKSKVNALFQIVIIASMNILEFILAPDLLLWGRYNIVFACLLIAIIWVNEFYIRKSQGSKI